MTTENKNNRPPVYMITIKDHVVSNYYKTMCITSWEEYFNCHIFDAVTPETLPDQGGVIPFAPRKFNGNIFSKTERACFYSHFNLWKKCFEENLPLIVVEHDITLVREIPDRWFSEYKMICLANALKSKGKLATLAGGAYYLTPPIAKMLVEGVTMGGPVDANSDAHILDKCQKYGREAPEMADVTFHPNAGVTIEHNGRGLK